MSRPATTARKTVATPKLTALASFTLRAIAFAMFNLAALSPSAYAIQEYALGTTSAGPGPTDEAYVYLSRPEACAALSGPFNPGPGYVYVGNIRLSTLNSHCIFDAMCVANFCAHANNPNPIGQFTTGFAVWGRTLTCASGFQQFAGCDDVPPKDQGRPDPQCCKANPVNVGTGNKYQVEPIYRASAGVAALALELHYNSYAKSVTFQSGPLTNQWSARYFVRVRDLTQGIVGVKRADGREYEFRAPASGTLYLKDADMNERLEKLVDGSGNLTGWKYTTDKDEVEEFDAAGKLLVIRDRAGLTQTMTYSTGATPVAIAPVPGLLIAVTDPFGRARCFRYNAQKRVVKIIDPAAGEYLIEHDGTSGPAGAGNITKITFPGPVTRTYHYAEAANINGGAPCSPAPAGLANLLTGITDEKVVRFATWTYDCQGRVTSSAHALGADQHTFTYGSSTSTFVDPLGASRSVATQKIQGTTKGTGTTQPAIGGGTIADAITHDANGNVATRKDWNGNRTNYTYDTSRNLETSRTEALNAAGATTSLTRTISTNWHSTFRLPTEIAEPLRLTTNTYDPDSNGCGARGALCSRTIQATTDASGAQGFSATTVGTPRTWTYTYNANGSVLTVNGPRTDAADVTAYTYYANDDADPGKRGNVSSISNALGHTTNITAYNAHGQPLTIVDPNGLTTTLAYDARQRLLSRAVGPEITTYDYDDVGQLTKVILPDGSFLNYDYDAAHRLTSISDNLGNSITYTLDAMGNRTAEQVRDPSNVLAQARSREFNSLNRLFKELGAQNQATEYAYDDQGNVLSVKDPLNKVTLNQYDALNRLKQVTDPGLGVTQYGYNGLDALTSVSDPRNLVTGYAVDGLGNLNQQVSPDTGATINTYDVAGNLLTQTDAKGQVTTYAYDALNRVTQITFHDGSKQAYAYDAGANRIGRLASITELDPASQQTNLTTYAYDLHGRVLSISTAQAGQVYTLGYSYDLSGRLSGLTYPSGRTVTYGFDALGRVNEITTTKDSQSLAVVQNVEYHPFGGVKAYTLGNGQAYSRSIDLDGRISTYTLGSKTFGIGYDLASRIEQITDLTTAAFNSYGYDALDRLTSATIPGTPFSYAYDAVGNRTSKTVGGTTDTYIYSPTSNRIATVGTRSFTFDSNGSTTSDGNNTYAYDVRGRMVQATSVIGATNYRVNALGQRIRKTNSLGDTVFHYDTNGKLIAETDPGGGVKREIFYLGDIPVGVFQ
jgi:YD repeat-containing protein